MAENPDDIAYTYVPQEGAFVTGIPQRDLTNADVAALGASAHQAAATGLYVPVNGKSQKTTTTPAPHKAEGE